MGLALDGDGLHQRGKDGERRFVGRNRERAEGRDGGRERERRGPNGQFGRSGQLKKDEEIGLCRRRRDSTERAGVPQTGRRLSGMRDPSPRFPSPCRSPRHPSTPLPHHYRPSRLSLLLHSPRANRQHTVSPLPIATHDRDRELLAMEPILSRLLVRVHVDESSFFLSIFFLSRSIRWIVRCFVSLRE